MKIQYGIAGFLIGIMLGLLLGLIEMKWMMGRRMDDFIPFVMGITVITAAVTGIIGGRKLAKRI
ncbi:MAG: hypothetical protein ABIS01_11385 [Ferruginibacter sp.]